MHYAVDGWYIQPYRIGTHLYTPLLLPSIPTILTRHQLSELDQSFFQPSVDNLFKLIRRAHPEEAHDDTRDILEDFTARCESCQRMKTGPKRSRVSFRTEDVVFNEQVLIAVMYIDSGAFLQSVEDSMHFSAARFLPNVSTTTI